MSCNERSSCGQSFSHKYECKSQRELSADYYRKVIFSGGMVHLMLGLAFGILWTVEFPLVFHVELAAGSCFLLSGIVGVFTGRLNNRCLDFTAMVTGILSALSCVILFVIAIYVSFQGEKHVLTNPWVGIFIIYALLGFAFAAVLTLYAYLAIKASKFSTTFRRRSSTGTSDTPATKMTSAVETNGAEDPQWLPMHVASSSATTASNDATSKKAYSNLC